MRHRSLQLAFLVPCVAAALALAGHPASAAAPAAGSKRFCTESTTLIKHLLAFGKLPKTTAAVSAALRQVDPEFARLALDAPTRADRKTITTMRTEFATLKKIVLTDPAGTRATDRAFVTGFARTADKQGLALGREIRAACR